MEGRGKNGSNAGKERAGEGGGSYGNDGYHLQ